MADEIKPALTPDEWAEIGRPFAGDPILDRILGEVHAFGAGVASFRTAGDVTIAWRLALHRIAALALYGQPFGFTREDVKAARLLGGDHADTVEGYLLLQLADRIAALLPPEP